MGLFVEEMGHRNRGSAYSAGFQSILRRLGSTDALHVSTFMETTVDAWTSRKKLLNQRCAWSAAYGVRR